MPTDKELLLLPCDAGFLYYCRLTEGFLYYCNSAILRLHEHGRVYTSTRMGSLYASMRMGTSALLHTCVFLRSYASTKMGASALLC